MADFNKYFPIIVKWEGGWSDHKADKGGQTNMGVTIGVWKKLGWDNDRDGDIDAVDLKAATKEQVMSIAKKSYWDIVGGDKIKSQAVAVQIADWGWGSGPVTAAKHVQRLLGLKDDGVVGNMTIAAINEYPNQQELFDKITKIRMDFLRAIVARDKSQAVFLKGWLNRVEDIVQQVR